MDLNFKDLMVGNLSFTVKMLFIASSAIEVMPHMPVNFRDTFCSRHFNFPILKKNHEEKNKNANFAKLKCRENFV